LGDHEQSDTTGRVCCWLGTVPRSSFATSRTAFPKAHLIGADCGYEALVARVVGFVEIPKIGLNLPLDVRGTAFQERVWKPLQEIPAGATVT
jgi:AraC family transcriptional regulator, regulatory protein of adaptative response / methylated-DNA-[protein]-cysteine methyltransferase